MVVMSAIRPPNAGGSPGMRLKLTRRLGHSSRGPGLRPVDVANGLGLSWRRLPTMRDYV